MKFNFEGVSVNFLVLNKQAPGRAVLFLHGWGGSVKSFEFFARKLPRKRPFVLLDFPPFGASSTPLTAWTIGDYTRMVARLMEQLNFRKYSIVAHSFGGRVALNLAKNGVKTVDKMVLTGCAGIRKRSVKRWFKVGFFKFLKFLSRLGIYPAARLEKKGSVDYQKLPGVMKKTFVNIVNFDSRNDIKKIECPVLLFWGKMDAETPFRFTKFFKKHIKDCEVVKTNGTHFAYIESADLFLRVLENFLI